MLKVVCLLLLLLGHGSCSSSSMVILLLLQSCSGVWVAVHVWMMQVWMIGVMVQALFSGEVCQSLMLVGLMVFLIVE